jgi:hypothetical protein
VLGRAAGALLVIISCAVAAAPPASALGSITIDDASVAEGNGGARSLQFTVHLSVPNPTAVTVDYATVDGTATAGQDFTAPSQTRLTIPAGATSGVISVALATDAFPEPNETFTVQLSNPSFGSTIGDATAIGTITNDDGLPPEIRVDDTTAAETDPSTLAFTVSLSVPAPQDTSVAYATVPGTATSGTDFSSTSGTALIAAGTVSTVVEVPVLDDALDEVDETVSLQLSTPINATLADGTGAGTIGDDDAAPVATVDAPSTGETDGATALTFTVVLDAPSGRTASLDYATADETATAGADYTATSGTLVFVPGDTTETVTVPVTGDNVDEPNETLTLLLSSPINLLPGQASATGTIVDDEVSPAMSIADLTIAEGNAGSAAALLTVSLSAASGQTVTVEASTGAGTATAGSDYDAVTSAVVTFPPGTTSQTVAVNVLGDVLDEANETAPVTLANPTNANIADGAATLTITDDDATPTLSITDGATPEGNAGNTPIELTVSLSAPSGRDVTVAASTNNGTASGGLDFASQSATALSIPAGSTSVPVPVVVFGDVLDEADESFSVALAGATNATLADGTATVSIQDDDSGPAASINDVSSLEGNPGSGTETPFVFTVQLSESSGQTVTVPYTTADGSATAGASSDYAATAGTVTFTPGQTSKTISVNVHRDLSAEPNETFVVQLSAPTNAVLATRSSGAGTIQNDDGPAPTLSVGDVSQPEGGGPATIMVSLSAISTQAVTVDVATTPGTAAAPADYAATSTTVTIAAGATSGTTTVGIVDDDLDEPDETFTAVLSNARNAGISDASGVVTIVDDDVVVGSLSIADATVAEGVDGSLTVTLSQPSGSPVTVQVSTADGTATAGEDYSSVATTLTFDPGTTTAQVTVPTIEDVVDESDESVTVELSAPTGGASVLDGTAVLTIIDDDTAPTVSIADTSVSEGDGGTTPATFTVNLSGPSAQPISVRAVASHVTTNANDGVHLDAIVTFAPGDTSEPVSAAVNGDTSPEGDETFTVTLSQPVGTTIADGSATGTVVDDDPAGTYTPVTPARILNTMKGIGRPGTAKVAAGSTIVLDVTGVGGVPATGVSAVVVNVAVVQPQAAGYVRVTPNGTSSTSNLNYSAGEVVANLVVVPVGGDGSIRLASTQTTHLVADVFGWFASDTAPQPGSHFIPTKPSRVLDTRKGTGVPGGTTAKLSAGTTRVLDVTGVAGVPATGVSAVVLNVAVTQPTVGSYLSVTPDGSTGTSNINFASGETASGLVIVPVGGDGSIRYRVGSGATHVVADVFGWFATPTTGTGSVLTTIAPDRIYDSRLDPAGAFAPGEDAHLQVAGIGDIPATGVASAVLNLAVTRTGSSGYLTATSDGTAGTANLNFARSQTVANLAIVPIDQEFGDFNVRNNSGGYTHVIVDAFAWFTTPAP